MRGALLTFKGIREEEMKSVKDILKGIEMSPAHLGEAKENEWIMQIYPGKHSTKKGPPRHQADGGSPHPQHQYHSPHKENAEATRSEEDRNRTPNPHQPRADNRGEEDNTQGHKPPSPRSPNQIQQSSTRTHGNHRTDGRHEAADGPNQINIDSDKDMDGELRAKRIRNAERIRRLRDALEYSRTLTIPRAQSPSA